VPVVDDDLPRAGVRRAQPLEPATADRGRVPGAPGATATVPLPLSRRALAALARRTRVQVRLAAAGAPPERVRVRVLRSPTR